MFHVFVLQSFTLEFHFEPNGYFNNAVLTKMYRMKSEPDASEPFSFEGPEIIDCEGWEFGPGYLKSSSPDDEVDF